MRFSRLPREAVPKTALTDDRVEARKQGPQGTCIGFGSRHIGVTTAEKCPETDNGRLTKPHNVTIKRFVPFGSDGTNDGTVKLISPSRKPFVFRTNVAVQNFSSTQQPAVPRIVGTIKHGRDFTAGLRSTVVHPWDGVLLVCLPVIGGSPGGVAQSSLYCQCNFP